MKEKLPKVDEKKVADLMSILERHFDPEKKPSKRNKSQERRGGKSRTEKKTTNDDKENNNNTNKSDSGHDSPDTTSGSPMKQNGESDEIEASQKCDEVINACCTEITCNDVYRC